MTPLWLVAAAHAADVVLVGSSYVRVHQLGPKLEGMLAEIPGHEDATTATLNGPGFTLVDHLAATAVPGPWRLAFVEGEGIRAFALQDGARVAASGPSSAAYLAEVDAAVELDALVAAQGADTTFLLTWAFLHGDEENPSIDPDFPTMQDHIDEGYRGLLEATSSPTRPTFLIPAGLCWRVIWDRDLAGGRDPTAPGSDFEALYAADGGHPSGAGSALVAATTFAALTGRDPVALPPPEGVDPASAAALRQVATEVVLGEPFAHPYPWAKRWEAVAARDEVRVADTWTRPLVQVDGEATTARLVVGGDGDGEVRVPGRLVVEAVEVGPGGVLALAGGVVEVTESGAGSPIGEGTLVASGVWTTDLELPAGIALDLHVSAPLALDGKLVARGPVSVAGEPQEVVDVVRARSVALSGPVTAPAGTTWSVVDDGGGQVLRITPGPGTPVGPRGVEEEPGGCGCGGLGRTGGWPLLGVLLAGSPLGRRARSGACRRV